MTWIAGQVVTAAELNYAAPEEWQSYTPTIAGGFTVGSGTVQGWYSRHGQTICMYAVATLGTGFTMGNGFGFSLPVQSVVTCTTYARFGSSGVNIWAGAASLSSTAITAFVTGTNGAATALSGTVPFTWKASDTFELGAVYRGVA